RTHGSYHWLAERGLSLALLIGLPVGLYTPNVYTDLLLAFTIPVHLHMGLGQVIIDYLPSRKMPLINKAARGTLYGSTALLLYVLLSWNEYDIGVGEGIKRIWSGKK
ncbi:hypothetical protein ROZALSC1DRAFT_10475, partial [Rozella allomycis CSF55]